MRHDDGQGVRELPRSPQPPGPHPGASAGRVGGDYNRKSQRGKHEAREGRDNGGARAERAGEKQLEVRSGELHRRVGAHHWMPSCCTCVAYRCPGSRRMSTPESKANVTRNRRRKSRPSSPSDEMIGGRS